jgi:hypothetical protein
VNAILFVEARLLDAWQFHLSTNVAKCITL